VFLVQRISQQKVCARSCYQQQKLLDRGLPAVRPPPGQCPPDLADHRTHPSTAPCWSSLKQDAEVTRSCREVLFALLQVPEYMTSAFSRHPPNPDSVLAVHDSVDEPPLMQDNKQNQQPT